MNNLYIESQDIAADRSDYVFRLMLFDLSIYGHHPGYIQYLLEYFSKTKLNAKIIVLVSPRFLTEHNDVVQLANQLDTKNIQFVAITQVEEDSLRPRNNSLNRNLRNFQEWSLFCHYVKQLKIDRALLMYYDTYQYPLALRLNPQCSVLGIYFRPTFHYQYFSNSSEGYSNLPASWEKFVLNLVFSNPKVDSLLTLDPFVKEFLRKDKQKSKLVYLPDPVRVCEYSQVQLQQIKASLNIESSRKLFLLFGALTDRKGIYQLLDSIPLLPKNICEKIAFAFVGEASQDNQTKIENKIADLSNNYPIQIYRQYEFLPEEDIQAYFEVSDFVLALYQNHVGMSGILNLAAAKHKPVLSSDYGLMGELVKQYHLGLAVDSTNPQKIAEGVEQILSLTDTNYNRVKVQEFTELNSADRFAEIIFAHLLSTSQIKNS